MIHVCCTECLAVFLLGIHDLQDDRVSIFSVWTKGGSTVVTGCLFPSDRCFIKVSITYQKMPASLKRNCNGSVYQCPVVEYRQQPFVSLFVVNIVCSPRRTAVIILPMMKHLYDREYGDIKIEAVYQCQNLSEGTV